MFGSNEPDPAGWHVPVHRSLTEPLLIGGIPRQTAILLGTFTGATGLYITLWVVPVALLLWVALAAWARHDPQGMAVCRRFWHQKTHYYG